MPRAHENLEGENIMDVEPVRRVVTGHDASGKAIIQEDGCAPRAQRIGGEVGPMFFEANSNFARR